jgi:hypothetical protein
MNLFVPLFNGGTPCFGCANHEEKTMQLPKDINEYLRAWAPELGERILQTYPPLHGFDDEASPLTSNFSVSPFRLKRSR